MIKQIRDFQQNRPLVFDISLGLFTALCFSAFLYLEHFGVTLKLLNTLFGVLALTLLLYIPKRAVLVGGFFIGLLWFYWIGYSFKYTGVGFLEPFITFGFAIIYMLFFGVLALSNSVALRAVLLFGLSFVEPFDFNWMQIELLFVDSYIGVFKYQLALVLAALTLPHYLPKPWKYTPLLLILLAISWQPYTQSDAPLKIKLVQTNIKQEEKWQPRNANAIIQENLLSIQKAIDAGYDLVVLPESAFPLFMNTHPSLQAKLSKLSKHIAIVVGALLKEKNNHYNVTYLFEDGNISVAKKMVLVPFGEYIPLPKFAQKLINDYFFAGQADFIHAKKPTDFLIKGVKFRNAICYEATCEEIYKGDVNFVLAISNNAWFAPSIEPTLQKLLMRFYARKNNATIYHAANYKGTAVVK